VAFSQKHSFVVSIAEKVGLAAFSVPTDQMHRWPPLRQHSSKTIAISKIPANQNNLRGLLHFFKKYGHIESVWCHGTRAVVSFANDSSAMSAFLDPDPYLNNRFVRIAFHPSPASNESNLEQFIDTKLVNVRVAEVGAAWDAKMRNQESLLRTMRSTTTDNLERLKKRRSEFVLAALQLISSNAAASDEELERRNQLRTFRELIDESQFLIDQFNHPKTSGNG
jgi:hypothetical protein